MTLANLTTSADQSRRLLTSAKLSVALLSLALVALFGRVVQLQLYPQPQIAARTGDRLSNMPIAACRGALLDCRGRPLAMTKLCYSLFADPQMINDPDEFAAHVGHLLGRDPVTISKALAAHADGKFVMLDRLLSDSELDEARLAKTPGLGLEPRPIRVYPQASIAGQLVGFVGYEGKGLDGLERSLEPVLKGDNGSVPMLRDVRRHPLWVERTGFTPPRDGVDVRMSIDTAVQYIAEEELAKACKQYRSKRGEMIVMDSRTGQILAMANYPSFDPSNPDQNHDARRNACITDPFEPGSIFKPFIWSAATAAGLAKPETMVDCENGLWVAPSGRRLRDAHGQGVISWEKVLIVSSNIGMGKIGSQLGPQRMNEVVRSFGFGRHTGIGLSGESVGILNPMKRWTSYSITSIPMGQEIGVTPLQMVRAFSVFANQGMIVSPSLLADEANSPLLQRVLSPAIANQTKEMLRRVVTEGTGKKAQSHKYEIWGKTGTAQVPDPGHRGYKEGAFNASFICGAPLAQPRIIVMCTVHEPDRAIGHFGGTVAAPAAREVVERTLTYLGVAADANPEDPHAPKVVTVTND